MTNEAIEFIGLDVGAKRIGVARINTLVGIAEPLRVLDSESDTLMEQIHSMIQQLSASGVVVGLPRGLDGQETQQTVYSREFARMLKSELSVPVYVIDEAGSSREADELVARGVSGAQDSIAAGIILETFIQQKDIAVYEVGE
jgi:putative Holliday junction resolvase